MVQEAAIISNIKIICDQYQNFIFFVTEIKYYLAIRDFKENFEFNNYIKNVLCSRRRAMQNLKENKTHKTGKNRFLAQTWAETRLEATSIIRPFA